MHMLICPVLQVKNLIITLINWPALCQSQRGNFLSFITMCIEVVKYFKLLGWVEKLSSCSSVTDWILFVVDSKLEKRPVTFGKAGTAATMLCVCHSPKDDLCFTGSDTGLVYVWQGTTLYRSVQAHKGAVCAMYSLSQSKQQVWCLK